ncbi:phosphate ABC transporter permease PstA [Alteromonas oceanisediminis]
MVAILLLTLMSIIGFILIRGSAYFWPLDIYTLTYANSQTGVTAQAFAQIRDESMRAPLIMQSGEQGAIKQRTEEQNWWLSYVVEGRVTLSRELLDPANVLSVSKNPNVAEITLTNGETVLANPLFKTPTQTQRQALSNLQEARVNVDYLQQQIESVRRAHLSPIHEELAEFDRLGVANDAPARVRLTQQFYEHQQTIQQYQQQLAQYTLEVVDAQGNVSVLMLSELEHIDFSNQLNTLGKVWVSVSRIWAFLSDEPKQANTAGGVFPALFGTILMVLLMTLIVTPFGVLAAIYLSEYAPNNLMTAALRIGVSNMAGVPSIVYGVFGLGFFIYAIGGSIDSLFYADKLPSPTFGAPGLFWASLTMALLTLPVVVVATEEGLQRVPSGIRASSYALGATKIETIWYTVLPIASPGIMTGVILAIARAAGEVAPLMLVGAVKFAPTLPVDGEFPFLHLERQFMHLGVFIYDGAFHSQTDSQGSSMMFAACLLLLLCVFGLNLIAINLRARLRKRYTQGA